MPFIKRQDPATEQVGRSLKYALWTLMGFAFLSVLFYSEIPLFQQPQEKTQLHTLRWILIPHAIAGSFALLSGPFQFSTRIRQGRITIHRVVGRLYAASVVLGAPLAVASTAMAVYPKAIYFRLAIIFQASAWLATTVMGVYEVTRHHVAKHRAWMTRSYAVTFTFVGTRVLQPIPAWNRLGRFWFAIAIICFTTVALLIPQIMRWRYFSIRTPK